MSEEIVIGRFASTFGVWGWIKVISYTSPPENIISYDGWLFKAGSSWQLLPIENKELRGKHILAKIVGFDSPESVAKFTNCEIAIKRKSLPALDPGEYYWSDLIGLHVVTLSGDELGRVTEMLATGANDVLIVLDNSGKQRLLPYLGHVVKEIDLVGGKMLVDWDKDY